ncbi:MAG: hypothetical protein E7572_12890 [Ruminococcaceae bacterium]|nr:hypothetical protein [Oscillospiraceae bacterium]
MLNLTRLEILLKERGISKKHIADLFGRDKALFSNWKKGKSTPTEEQIRVIAADLDVSLDYLLGKTDTKKEPVQNEQALDPKAQEILADISDCSEDEIDSVRQYVAFLKSQRKP